MVEMKQIYKCEICGNMVEVVKGGAGKLVCCGKPMEQILENTTDAAQEKHVPVIERSGDNVKVSVGSVSHPMEEKHYIEWIEVSTQNKVYRKHLKPGDAPEATFHLCATCSSNKTITARAYCNLHGLWKA